MPVDYAKIEDEPVATKFVELLRSAIGEENFKLVLTRNEEESHRNVCHSHDFCDANMVMNESFKFVCGVDASDDINDEVLLAKWTSAWDYAKYTLMPAELSMYRTSLNERGSRRG